MCNGYNVFENGYTARNMLERNKLQLWISLSLCVLTCVHWQSFLLLRCRKPAFLVLLWKSNWGCSYSQKNADNNEGCILCAASKEGAGIFMFFVYSRYSFRVILFAFCLFASFFPPFLSFNPLNVYACIFLREVSSDDANSIQLTHSETHWPALW